MMRLVAAGFAAVLALPLGADVVVLKDGGMVSGRVTEKPTHFEVAGEFGTRTFLKDEVERVITDPKEILGDAERELDEAKRMFTERGDSAAREAAAKVMKAREAYARARELFPEDKYSDLDTKLMLVMQLLRILRDRMGSQIAGGGGPDVTKPGALPAPALTKPPFESAFAVLVDPALRGDAAKRKSARDAFLAERGTSVGSHEFATAAAVFLAREDTAWGLKGKALAALQEYFGKPWAKNRGGVSSADHLEAAKWLSAKAAECRRAEPGTPTDALSLFGLSHLAYATEGEARDRAARELGFQAQDGRVGTEEGFVVRDLARWVRAGDYDLAALAFAKEYRGTDTPAVRYVWSWAILQLAHEKAWGFQRAQRAFETIKSPPAWLKPHVDALVASIKAEGTCDYCRGEGKNRCVNCHGQKDIKYVCKACDGTGKMKKSGGFQLENCPPCKSSGIERIHHCTKCKDGWFDCTRCPAAKSPPERSAIASTSACGLCEGRGQLFRHVLWACPQCLGLGSRVTPRSAPEKVLAWP